MAKRSDTTEAIRAVEVVESKTRLMTPDGRPVIAISEYIDVDRSPQGHPVRAVSVDPAVAAEGGRIDAVAIFPQGTLAAPDGRPIVARAFFNAAGNKLPFALALAGRDSFTIRDRTGFYIYARL